MGRPPLGDKKLSPKELRQRFNSAITDSGGKILTIRLRDPDASRILSKLTEVKGFNSDTAAATAVLISALKRMESGLLASEEKAKAKAEAKTKDK